MMLDSVPKRGDATRRVRVSIHALSILSILRAADTKRRGPSVRAQHPWMHSAHVPSPAVASTKAKTSTANSIAVYRMRPIMSGSIAADMPL